MSVIGPEKTAKERGLPLVGDQCSEQGAWVYLVWGITKEGRCDLLCVAAREETRMRYEEMGWRRGMHPYRIVKSELVLIDHAFGQSMLPNSLNRAAEKR
jgi:hypothetical protein